MDRIAADQELSRYRCTLEQALRHLRGGRALVFPTDTVFGLGVAVFHAPSPDVLYRLKRRDAGKPIAWLISSKDDLGRFGKDVPQYAEDLARKGWPGALTLVVPASEAVPPAYRSKQGSIGLRMPKSALVLKLIEELGSPLAATSANLSGGANVGSAERLPYELVRAAGALYEGEEGAEARRNDSLAPTPSRVVDCTGPQPFVLRG